MILALYDLVLHYKKQHRLNYEKPKGRDRHNVSLFSNVGITNFKFMICPLIQDLIFFFLISQMHWVHNTNILTFMIILSVILGNDTKQWSIMKSIEIIEEI